MKITDLIKVDIPAVNAAGTNLNTAVTADDVDPHVGIQVPQPSPLSDSEADIIVKPIKTENITIDTHDFDGDHLNSVAMKFSAVPVYCEPPTNQSSMLDVPRILDDTPLEYRPIEECVPETNLNDDQIAEVMSYLLKIRDRYFSGEGREIPLAKDLCKNFVWNLPTPVYKAFKDAEDYMHPDIMNPLMLMYIYCVEDPGYYYPRFLAILEEEMFSEEDVLRKAYDENFETIEEDAEDE